MLLPFLLITIISFSCKEHEEVIPQKETIKNYTQYVNPFIGTSNYGTTNPGPIAVRGMVSVSPFNVAGSQNFPLEKDAGWLSTPYVKENPFLTGFSHVNLSGVGCPDLGVILTMPTSGALETNHLNYGSTFSDEISNVGYYSTNLEKYNIKVETTATTRTGVSRYTFPEGESNILLNLGLGLTNEQGARVKVKSRTEVEGMRTVGSFCYYKPEEAYPVYFVIQFSEPADEFGVWKKYDKYEGPEATWMSGYNGKTQIKKDFMQEVSGDSIGVYMKYHFENQKQVEMKVGVSYVSIENARENLEIETGNKSFQEILEASQAEWNEHLARIEVEGGSEEDKTKFYTALYHTLVHPNILNDANGEYPKMRTRETMHSENNRYTTFSFWDTYRNNNQLMSLVYPEQQLDMIKSMLQVYDESGWLPKWELNATETTTMVGDPAGIVIADSYLRGITDFDVEKAYEAMTKSAEQLENNLLRPGLKDYLEKGYLTTSTTSSGSVSTTQEYNISDFAIAQLAKVLNKKEDYEIYSKRAISYRNLFDTEFNLLRPKNADGSWVTPYNPETGANFVKNLGFIEGNAWQYTFMVSHDVDGLITLFKGEQSYVDQLQKVFDNKQFDMANEPDIGYPYLFNHVKGEEWRTQKTVSDLLNTYYKNAPDGLPGNDDTGTMSAWAVFSMMGIYPSTPAVPEFAFTKPKFKKITIHLQDGNDIEITCDEPNTDNYIKEIRVDGTTLNDYFIGHDRFTKSSRIEIISKSN